MRGQELMLKEIKVSLALGGAKESSEEGEEGVESYKPGRSPERPAP